MQDRILDQFRQTGADLLRLGLTTSHGGNMSIRHQGKIIVTVHFAMLGRLEPGNLIEVPVHENPDHITSDASKDVALHQLIYRFTPAGPVIHAHPAYLIAMSLTNDMLAPRDLEGALFLREIALVAPAEAYVRIP